MKRLFAMILTLAVLLTVAACGGSPEDDAAKVPDQTERPAPGPPPPRRGKSPLYSRQAAWEIRPTTIPFTTE